MRLKVSMMRALHLQYLIDNFMQENLRNLFCSTRAADHTESFWVTCGQQIIEIVHCVR
jgi:hypothetical protein